MSNGGRATSQLWAGIILIALGVLFLLDRFWLLDFSRFFRIWWPSLLILIGAVQLITWRGRRRLTGPLVLITLGVIFQVERLDLFYWWRMRQMWPLILIAVGVGLLISRLGGHWNGSRGVEAKS